MRATLEMHRDPAATVRIHDAGELGDPYRRACTIVFELDLRWWQLWLRAVRAIARKCNQIVAAASTRAHIIGLSDIGGCEMIPFYRATELMLWERRIRWGRYERIKSGVIHYVAGPLRSPDFWEKHDAMAPRKA